MAARPRDPISATMARSVSAITARATRRRVPVRTSTAPRWNTSPSTEPARACPAPPPASGRGDCRAGVDARRHRELPDLEGGHRRPRPVGPRSPSSSPMSSSAKSAFPPEAWTTCRATALGSAPPASPPAARTPRPRQAGRAGRPRSCCPSPTGRRAARAAPAPGRERDATDQRRAREQVEEDRLRRYAWTNTTSGVPGQPAEQAARGPADLLRARVAATRGAPLPARPRAAPHRGRRWRWRPGGRAPRRRPPRPGWPRPRHELGDRPVRDALAVGQAAAAEDPSAPIEGGDELMRQPALPDPGLAEDRHEPRPALPRAPAEAVSNSDSSISRRWRLDAARGGRSEW